MSEPEAGARAGNRNASSPSHFVWQVTEVCHCLPHGKQCGGFTTSALLLAKHWHSHSTLQFT